jgi:hypothetical protein
MGRVAVRSADHQTRNSDRLAPTRILPLLELKKPPPQGRPCASKEVIDLIREMSLANPRWGAPRIHGGTTEAGIRTGRIDGRQIRRAPSETAFAGGGRS